MPRVRVVTKAFIADCTEGDTPIPAGTRLVCSMIPGGGPGRLYEFSYAGNVCTMREYELFEVTKPADDGD